MTDDDPNLSQTERRDAQMTPIPQGDETAAMQDAPPEPEDLAALQAWEPEATPGTLLALLPNKWVRRLVLGAIPTLALFFGSGLILASQLSVTHALQLFGTAAGKGADSAKALQSGRVEALLISGQENAFRVAIWNRRKKLHERHFNATLALEGGPGGAPRLLYKGVAGPGPALDARFSLPELEPGSYHLEISSHLADEPFAARVPARVVRLPHARLAVPIEPEKAGEIILPARPDPDDVTVELLPSSGHRISNELLERLTVRATHPDGQPAPLTGAIRLAAGRLMDAEKGQRVGKPFSTDPLGLHSLRILSRHPQLAFLLRYQLIPDQRIWKERPARERIVRLERRNAQALIEPETLMVRPGDDLGVTVFTLSSAGYVFLDLYSGGLRYFTATVPVSSHRGILRIPAPRRPGLFRIQVTDDFSNPGTGTVTRTLFATSDAPPSDARQRSKDKPGAVVAKAVAELARAVLAELPQDDKRTRAHLETLLRQELLGLPAVDLGQATAYLLSRLDHLHHPTDWLCDTTAAEARALRARKLRLQRALLVGFGFTALLLLGLVVPLVFVNLSIAKRGSAEREHLMADFEATADREVLEASLKAKHDADGDALITDLRDVREEHQRMERLRQRVQIFLVAGIILLAIGAILVLLLRLSWGWS
ncbi:MAG: hypothetical protein RBU30_15610 [Polyangia bacterium]|jgi:hypothetical protein|nr:hypothetical protein [Polyangia bacterium]